MIKLLYIDLFVVLEAPPAKLRNASLSSISEFFVLADSAELPIKLPIR